MSGIAFLFCCDYFDKTQPDSDYAEEYDYLKKRAVATYLFSLEDFQKDNTLRIAPSGGMTTLIYRGWMITAEQYGVLYDALFDKGFRLINAPEQYRQCHHLPAWYGLLADNTAESVWTDGVPDEQEVLKLLKIFGNKPIIVKDYVKSRKHEWNDACFIPGAADIEKALQIVKNFVSRQEDDLVGGVVLREYLPLQMLGKHEKSLMPIAKEVRIFCYRHRPFAYIQYWSGEKCSSISEFQGLIQLCSRLDSNFYTIDIAQQENGEWAIIEVGDGQVSGLQDCNAELFYDELLKVFEQE